MIPSAPGSRPRLGLPAWAGFLSLLCLAAWVRAWGLPSLARHAYEGHEAEYLQVFQHSWEGGWSTRIVPLLGLVYRGLGHITQHPAAPLGFSLALGLISITALVFLVRGARGPGLLAGLFVALYGNHAFWSSSAYNVIAPHALLLSALALLGWPGWWSTLVSGLLLGAAAGTRVELVALALPALLLLHRRSWPQRAAWLACAATVYGACLLPMLEPGAHPSGLLEQAPAALAANLATPVFLAPWDAPRILLPALALAALGCWRHRRLGALLVGVAITAHVTASAFGDMGFRHALLTGVALCGLQALGISALRDLARARQGWRLWALMAASAVAFFQVVLVLAHDTARVAGRYYAPSAPLMAQLEAENPAPVDPGWLERCAELITQPLAGPSRAAPFELDGDECWLWLEDWQHRRWTSLGVHDRGARMHHGFDMRPLGMVGDPTDPGRPPRQVWLLEARR